MQYAALDKRAPRAAQQGEDRHQTAQGGTHRVDGEEVAEEDPEHHERDQPDEEQTGRLQPMDRREVHPEREPGGEQEDQAHDRHHIAAQHLRSEVREGG